MKKPNSIKQKQTKKNGQKQRLTALLFGMQNTKQTAVLVKQAHRLAKITLAKKRKKNKQIIVHWLIKHISLSVRLNQHRSILISLEHHFEFHSQGPKKVSKS